MNLERGGNVHRRWEGVVGRLRSVHMIIGMNRLFRSDFAAQHLDRSIGDHFVDVHVGLGARPCLPNHQGKVFVELALDDLIGGRDDGLRQLALEEPHFDIGQGCSLLDDAERTDERRMAFVRRRF